MAKPFYFANEQAAQEALDRAGCSLGRQQGGSPRGILVGDFDIQKWRNLRNSDRSELHGIYQRHSLGGLVEITLSRDCPTKARNIIDFLSTDADS